MRTPVRFRSWAISGGLSLCPALASAEEAARPYPPCERTPTQGDIAAAKGAFDAGNGSFNEADYDRAITYWEDAYRRDCTAHPLLLNLARAYELRGQKQHAVTALQTFLVRSPGSSDEGQIKRRIDKLQEQLQSEAAAAPVPAAAPGPAPQAAPPPPPGPAPALAEAPPPPSGGSRPIAPLIVAGAGAALTIVSGIIYLGAVSDVSKFENQCGPQRNACPTDSVRTDANSARSRENISGVLALVGIGALVGGGVWYLVSKPSATAASAPRSFVADVSPAVGPGYGGMQVAGRF